MHKDFKHFKTVMVLNGHIPDKQFFLQLTGCYIVGVDGGANRLLSLGIVPDLVVGDLDGIDKGRLSQNHIPVVHLEDQNFTDFEKALEYVNAKRPGPILILGMNGGEIDHILNNIHVFIRYSSKFDLTFYDEHIPGQGKFGMCVSGKKNIACGLDKNVSIFSFFNGKISSNGLCWELTDDKMYFLQRSGARNRSKEPSIKLKSSKKSKLLVIA